VQVLLSRVGEHARQEAGDVADRGMVPEQGGGQGDAEVTFQCDPDGRGQQRIDARIGERRCTPTAAGATPSTTATR